MTVLRTKFVIPETKVLDDKAGRIHAIVSSEVQDRDGDIIRVAGWKLENFLTHPLLLSSHNYGTLLSQIGEWESMEIKDKKLEGVARYYVGEGNQEADWAFNIASKGRAAFSVGFMPDMTLATELENPGHLMPSYEFNGQELLEVSHVVIPSNPEALQRQLKSLMAAIRRLEPSPEQDESISVAPVDYRELLNTACSRAYREVNPW